MRVHSISIQRATDGWGHSVSPFLLTVNGKTFGRHMTKEEIVRNIELYLEDMK